MHLTDFHSLELYFPPYASFLFWAFLGLTEIAIKTISLAYAISQLFESSTTIIHDLGCYERIYPCPTFRSITRNSRKILHKQRKIHVHKSWDRASFPRQKHGPFWKGACLIRFSLGAFSFPRQSSIYICLGQKYSRQDICPILEDPHAFETCSENGPGFVCRFAILRHCFLIPHYYGGRRDIAYARFA